MIQASEIKIAWKATLQGLRVAPDHREEPRCILDEGEDALGQEPSLPPSSLEGCTGLAFTHEFSRGTALQAAKGLCG